MFSQIGGELELLFRAQIVAVAAHQREQATVLAGDGIDLAPAVQEVMVDDANASLPAYRQAEETLAWKALGYSWDPRSLPLDRNFNAGPFTIAYRYDQLGATWVYDRALARYV